MTNPKWGVLAVIITVFAMAATYDVMLGIAAGVGLAALAIIYLTIRALFMVEPEQQQQLSKRSEFASRFARLNQNRRKAAAEEQADPRSRD